MKTEEQLAELARVEAAQRRQRFDWAMRELEMCPVDPKEKVPEPGRVACAASWLVWHAPELGSVGGPALVGIAVTPWAWPVSGMAAAVWAVRAALRARQQAALKASFGRPRADATTDDATDADATAEVDPTNEPSDGAEPVVEPVAETAGPELREVWL